MASYSHKEFTNTESKRLKEIKRLLNNTTVTKEEKDKLKEERNYILETMQPMYGGSRRKSTRKMRKSKARKSKSSNTMNKK